MNVASDVKESNSTEKGKSSVCLIFDGERSLKWKLEQVKTLSKETVAVE
jgi:hypothetical protein